MQHSNAAIFYYLSVLLVLLAAFAVDQTAGEYNCEYKKDGFYSDTDFCHIYWRCNYGVAEEYECPAGTAWNHIESRCDWLDNVDCSRIDESKKEEKKDDEEEEKESDTTKKPKKNKGKTTETPETTAPPSDTESNNNNNNNNNNDESLVESKSAAAMGLKMKAILISRTVVTNSPQLTERSENDKDNDDDDENNNSNDHDIKWLSDEDRYTLYKKIVEETSLIDYDAFCDNTTATAFFREDPFICNKYIRCNHGFAQRFKCAKHTAWDVKKKQCLWAQYVKCGKRQLITNEKLLGKNDSDESMKRNGTRLAPGAGRRRTTTRPIKTTRIIRTTTAPLAAAASKKRLTTRKKNGAANIRELMVETTTDKSAAANNNNNNNENKNNAASNGQSGAGSANCQSFGSYYVADNTNCAAYYMCNNGKETKMNCADKQLFNSETSQCEEFQQVFCGSRPVNLADRNQCSSKRDGIYPDLERSCRVFYQCINQQKVREANCPNNLKFNAITGRCDNPANILAPCGNYIASDALKQYHTIASGSIKSLTATFALLVAALRRFY